LSRLELQIMEALWKLGPSCIRDILGTFPAKKRPAYTTIQTTIYRLEAKNAVRRTKKVGNVHVFDAAIARADAHRRLVGDFLDLFGDRSQPASALWNYLQTFFGGSRQKMMTALLSEGSWSDEDLATLRAQIDRVRKGKKQS